MRKILEIVARRRAVAGCRRFLMGYRCLTENGVARVERAIGGLTRYVKAKCRSGGSKLKELEEIWAIVMGLQGFLRGDEEGFAEYERFETERRLVEFINRKGRV